MNKLIPLALLCAAPLITGCATAQPGSVGMLAAPAASRGSLAYMPTQAPGARLPSERLPKLLLARVSDETNGGTYQGPMAYSMPLPWSTIVQDALNTELPRLGWTLTRSKDMAGASLHATVIRAHAAWRAGFMVKVHTQLTVSYVLRDASGQDVWEAEVTGQGLGTAGGGGVPGNGIKESFTAALADAMSKLGPTFDEQRPWEKLGKPRPAAAAPAVAAAPEPAPAPVPGWSDVDQVPSAKAKRKGHAVIIGIERYRNKLPTADYASGDANLMAKYAAAVLGYPEENIALLTNDGASKSDFEKHFERWLSNRVEKDDEVFVYFSGHGAPNPQTGDAYLVPYDGDPMYLAETGYPIKRMYEALAKLPAKKVTVALDSCFSGAGGRSVIAKGARPLVTVKAVEAPAGVTVIAASSGEQISNSFDEKGHGLFTYFFLKGLKEKGADFKAAFDYAKPEVAKVARRQFNADQEPQWSEGR